MGSREWILPYFGTVIALYLWENILFGNLTAYHEQEKGKIQLPTIMKKILFPLFNIKRFTNINIIYQAFNFCVFFVMIFIGGAIGIFGVNDFILCIINFYKKLQQYYWLAGPLLLDVSLKFYRKER